jgi:redox-sensitive bicupin YhaK (pirin superfamily)
MSAAEQAEPGVEVRRAGTRAVTRAGGIETRHSFSFGGHYDPTNVGHALLVAHNDDLVAAGSGYDTHPHQDLEIVTWVLDGALKHEDSRGHTGLVTPGLAQRLSAGSGVLHAEHNDADTGPSVRFVQMWVLPDEPGGDPDYAQQDVTGGLAGGDWLTLASGLPRDQDRAAVPIRQRGAALHVVRLAAGQTVTVPDAPFVHLFVATGAAELEGAGQLAEADAVRLTGAGARALTGTGGGCEVLAWEMHAARP